jgi:hypothetical protein
VPPARRPTPNSSSPNWKREHRVVGVAGGPKTAYLYCDDCGALVDYDFRLANSGTSAGLTNTVLDFRDRMAAYCAESQLRKDFDPGLARSKCR